MLEDHGAKYACDGLNGPEEERAPYGASVHDWPLDSADLIDVVTGRLGSLHLYEVRDPIAILIVANGAISLRMIRREIELVTTFAAGHPQGWCYLGDVRRVRLLNPVNLLALRRIARDQLRAQLAG